MGSEPMNDQGPSVGAVLAAWSDLDRLLALVSPDEAIAQPGPGRASIGWTIAHLARQVDSWINVAYAGRAEDPMLAAGEWGLGGDGTAIDWPGIQRAAAGVRSAAVAYLASVPASEILERRPYTGSIAALHGRQVSLGYRLVRITAHTYFHIGAMAADLVATGRSVGDYPGSMLEALDPES